MGSATETKGRIMVRLQEGSATAAELEAITGLSLNGIKSTISRLRNDGFRIMGEAGSSSGNPRYTLVNGPNSLGPTFICPVCAASIRLGHGDDHAGKCSFGPHQLRNAEAV